MRVPNIRCTGKLVVQLGNYIIRGREGKKKKEEAEAIKTFVMEKQCLSIFVRYLSFLVLLRSCGHCNAMESPQYTVVRSASNVEIRLYRESLWMSALVRSGGTSSSFNNSTEEGFHRFPLHYSLFGFSEKSHKSFSNFGATTFICTKQSKNVSEKICLGNATKIAEICI